MKTRRTFIRNISGLTAGIMLPLPIGCTSSGGADALGQILPLRKLGSTGEKVTMLGLGGYHVGWTAEKDAQEVIETAISGGIRFFDTAHNYGKGMSETRYGKYLIPKYREHIFLMTKSQAKTGEDLLREVDLSLSRMKTDRVDLLQLHSFASPEDVDNRTKNGVMEAIISVKETGKARHIGFTGHASPYAHLRMMELMDVYPDFATLQMPINLVDHNSEHSFVNKTLPAALDQGLGILAMKTLADGRFFSKKQMNENVVWETGQALIPGQTSVADALNFVWSLPVSVLITGAENKDLLIEKINLAKKFSRLSEQDRIAILDRAANAYEPEKIEYYKNV